jgi:hypothetical protein
MTSIFRLGALVLTVAALLSSASIANAKGGGGGGGGGGGTPCATIDNFAMSGGYVGGQPSITWSATTTNLCLDERAGSTGIDFKNGDTGFVGREVYAGLLTRSFGSTFTATPGTTYTITVTVYKANGSVVASQTKSITAPPALVPQV